MFIHRNIRCLHEIEIQFFKKIRIGRKNSLDSKLRYSSPGISLHMRVLFSATL